MTRRFIDAPDALRCKAAIILHDKSGAQCGRYAKVGTLCTQHAKKEARKADEVRLLDEQAGTR